MGKDHKIMLLPLHGRMPKSDELEEMLRLTTNVAVLIDSERSKAGEPLRRDRQEFLDLCVARRIRAHVLERRATENYFPDQIVKQVFGPQYRALGDYEKFS